MINTIPTKPFEVVTAYLSDGRYVEVPKNYAEDWALEASQLDVTSSLGDWWTRRAEESADEDDAPEIEIRGQPFDNPRCDHEHDDGSAIVVNASQATSYVKGLPHAQTRTCLRRPCILDAMAWVERVTGEHAVWIDDDNEQPRADPPAPNDLKG